MSEEFITIDITTRTMAIPPDLYNIGVAEDQQSYTLHFKCPRYFNSEDLSKHDCVIRYINGGNQYGETDATNIVVADDYITFDWVLTNYPMKYAGKVSFTVQFETTGTYQWQTRPGKLNVWSGLNIEDTITDQDDTLFRSLMKQITALENEVASMKEIMDNLELQKYVNLDKRVTYLENNVVYILDSE